MLLLYPRYPALNTPVRDTMSENTKQAVLQPFRPCSLKAVLDGTELIS